MKNKHRAECAKAKWLLLIHRIPLKPAYLRVKIWRRLQRLGAVAIKHTVYVIPKTDDRLEDFHWVAREIIEAGGEAAIGEAAFLCGNRLLWSPGTQRCRCDDAST